MITLQYESTVITLRSPDIGDGVQQQLHTIVRRNRGGELKTYRDSGWNKVKIFNYGSIPINKLADKEAFMDFVEESAGQIVDLEDHHGDTYSGIILNASYDIETQKDNCSYTISFDFQVVSPDTCYMLTEDGSILTTEAGNNLVVETCGE